MSNGRYQSESSLQHVTSSEIQAATATLFRDIAQPSRKIIHIAAYTGVDQCYVGILCCEGDVKIIYKLIDTIIGPV